MVFNFEQLFQSCILHYPFFQSFSDFLASMIWENDYSRFLVVFQLYM